MLYKDLKPDEIEKKSFEIIRSELDGMGVEMDPSKAARYFLTAAQKGNISAQYNLAILYIQQPEALAKSGINASGAQALQW